MDFITILRNNNPRPRESKPFTHSYWASELQNRRLNPGLWASKSGSFGGRKDKLCYKSSTHKGRRVGLRLTRNWYKSHLRTVRSPETMSDPVQTSRGPGLELRIPGESAMAPLHTEHNGLPGIIPFIRRTFLVLFLCLLRGMHEPQDFVRWQQ